MMRRIILNLFIVGVFLSSSVFADITVDGVSQGNTINNSQTIEDVFVSSAGGDSITNRGTITSDTNGMNQSPQDVAVYISGTLNSFTNRGTIAQGSIGDTDDEFGAITIVEGVVSNFMNSGKIDGRPSTIDGMSIQGTVTSFVNSENGIIIGLDDGLRTNQLVDLSRSTIGTFLNEGKIIGVDDDGVQLDELNLTTFTNNGSIKGNDTAIEVDEASITTLINNGAITGTSDNGVEITDSSSVGTLLNSGAITAGDEAIYVSSSLLTTLTNDENGVIVGENGIAIFAESSGNVETFNNSGTVTGNVHLGEDDSHTFNMLDGMITGSIDMGNGGIHTIALINGQITGLLDVGDIPGSTPIVNASSFQIIKVGAFAGEQFTLHQTGEGTIDIGGNVTDTVDGDNDIVLNIDAGKTRFSANSIIDGGFDADGATFDVSSNDVTIKTASDLAADAGFGVAIGSFGSGELNNASSDVPIVFNDGATVHVVTNGSVDTSSTYVIVDATGAGGGSNLSATDSNLTLSENIYRYDFTLQKIGDQLILTPTETLDISDENMSVFQNADNLLSTDQELYTALNNLSSDEEFEAALDSLESDQTLVVSNTQLLMTEALGTVENRILEVRASGVSTGSDYSSSVNNIGTWIQVYGSVADQDSKQNHLGYDASAYGTTIGFDQKIHQTDSVEVITGLAYSFGESNIDMKQSQNDSHIQSHQLTVYTGTQKGETFFDGSLSMAFNNYETSRFIEVGSVRRQAKADFDGVQYGADLRLGHSYDRKGLKLTPYIGAEYRYLDLDAYQEHGAGAANLIVDSDDYQVLAGVLGIMVEREIRGQRLTYVPKLTIEYSHDFKDDDVEATSSFAGGGTSFETNGLKPDQDTLNLKVDLKMATKENLEFNFGYEANVREDYLAHNIRFNIRWDF